MNYAELIEGTMVLIMVDSYSGWIEALPTPAATSAAAAEHLRSLLGRFVLPVCLVSDNGTSFTRSQFTEIISRNGIWHLRSAFHHPQSNGLAERAMRMAKDALMKESNLVFAKNFGVGERWVPRVIARVLGNSMALVQSHHGSLTCHIDQLCPQHQNSTLRES